MIKKWSIMIASLLAALVLVSTSALVIAHGGTIEAKSEPGEGAEFIVGLPAAVPDPSA